MYAAWMRARGPGSQNSRAVRRLDRRCVHSDLPSISRFIPAELFVGLEIYDRPAPRLLKGEIDYTLDQQAIGIAPRDRHFTTTPPLLRSMARAVIMRPANARIIISKPKLRSIALSVPHGGATAG